MKSFAKGALISVLSFGLLIPALEGSAQSVGISNNAFTPNGSSILELKSTTKGFLMPRMNFIERNAILNPATGLIIYQTNNTPGYYFYDGAAWMPIQGGGTDNLGNHEYTQDMDMNGHWLSGDGDAEGIFINSDGEVGIGTSTPSGPFQVEESTSSDPFIIRAMRNSAVVGDLAGIGFGAQGGSDVIKSGMIHEREGANGIGKLHLVVDNATDNSDVSLAESRVTIDRNGKVGIGTTSPSEMLHSEGNLRLANGAYIDDDGTMGGDNDDWIRLNGYVEMKGDNDDYGLVLRDKDNSQYLGITQKNGWSYFSDNAVADDYFLRGNGPNIDVRGDIRVFGSDIYDNGGDLRLSGEDNVNITMDYNNNDNNTMAIIFGKNNMASPTELMRIEEGGNVGSGTSSPSEMLEVDGNGQVTGYLKVGDPATPQSDLSNAEVMIYGWTSDMAYAGWTRNSICGSGSSDWVWLHENNFPNFPNYFEYDNSNSRSKKELHSPWMYVPTASTTVRVEVQFDCTLENNYDGVFLSYSTDGSSWTKIDGFSYHGYPDNANGSNDNCNGSASSSERACWNGNLSNYSCWTNGLSLSGTWVQFKLTGMADNSNGSGDFRMYGFSVNALMPGDVGGSFQAGNVYAENNVYAGSNVMLGDVAEYFAVNGRSEAGDVISIASGSREAYKVSSKAYDDQVIGVYSTAPTVTLNDPNSGVPVGLRGRVPVKVTASNGAIKVGDAITAAHIPGHAMKADRPCYIIGRALEPFEGEGEGKILCLLENGWYNPTNTDGFSSTGNFDIQKGKNTIKVYDQAVSKNSKIFLTLLGDPGHRFWISEKADGAFTIELSGESLGEVPFDYLVENATGAAVENEVVLQSTEQPADFESGDWKFDEAKGVYWREQEKTGQKVQIPELTQLSPPQTPENTSNAYIYNEQTKSSEVTFEAKRN